MNAKRTLEEPLCMATFRKQSEGTTMRAMADYADALKAENEKLRKALEAFAAMLDASNGTVTTPDYETHKRMLEAARAALKVKE